VHPKPIQYHLLAIPVDGIIGFPLEATSINGMSVISKKQFYRLEHLRFQKSTTVLSKGEEKQTNPSSLATLNNSSCHSRGIGFLIQLIIILPSDRTFYQKIIFIAINGKVSAVYVCNLIQSAPALFSTNGFFGYL
jgi:hypothetical protein